MEALRETVLAVPFDVVCELQAPSVAVEFKGMAVDDADLLVLAVLEDETPVSVALRRRLDEPWQRARGIRGVPGSL